MARPHRHDAAAPPRVWNVCTGIDPALAGMYRGIVDFSRALDGPILSFGGGADAAEPSPRATPVPVRRLACGPNPPGYECLVVGPAAATAAATIVGDADLLVAHSLFRGHVAWAAADARRRGATLWSVPHGCLDPRGLAHRWLAKRAWLEFGGGRSLAEAAFTVFATHRERDKAAAWTFSRRAAVVPWPVPLPDLADRPAARVRFRQRLGMPERAGILLSVGRLHSVKRPLEMVTAFCAAAGPADHLVLVGMDDDIPAARIVRAIPERQRGQVHVVGPLHGPALHEAWLAADGFVALSRKENFGYAFAEALSYGLPVIVSPGHDLAWELPRDRSGRWPHGWLLPDDDPATAAAAIAAFADVRRRAEDGPAEGWSTARAWVADELAPGRFRERLLGLR